MVIVLTTRRGNKRRGSVRTVDDQRAFVKLLRLLYLLGNWIPGDMIAVEAVSGAYTTSQLLLDICL